MKFLLITDAWDPQINGVVKTWKRLTDLMIQKGHEVTILHPGFFKTLPCPGYPEIRLAVNIFKLRSMIDSCAPQAIHIATEGPLGFAASRILKKRRIPYTSSYHTRFPEYVRLRLPVPLGLSYHYLKSIHRHSSAVLVGTKSLKDDLSSRGFKNLVLWTRGIETDLFHPAKRANMGLSSPILLYVGRVAIEKNLEAFLNISLPGASHVVVGDGPARQSLSAKYPHAHFLGVKQGEELARIFASSDVFVFPSKTDTFGQVILESLASGIPVAGYPVTGPKDIIENGVTGVLHDDLYTAVVDLLKLKSQGIVTKEGCRNASLSYTWENALKILQDNLVQIDYPHERSRSFGYRARSNLGSY